MANQTVVTKVQAPARVIVSLMAIASLSAIIGEESRSSSLQGSKPSVVKIIGGFTVGTVALTLLASAGNTAENYAEGLALLTMLSSLLIYGTDLAGVINHVSGTSSSTSTTSTTPTTTTSPTTSKGSTTK